MKSTISEEVPINYENKVPMYDDYCDDMYAIKNNDNHETCHYDSFCLIILIFNRRVILS